MLYEVQSGRGKVRGAGWLAALTLRERIKRSNDLFSDLAILPVVVLYVPKPTSDSSR